MAWTKAKTAIVAGAAVLLAGGAATMAIVQTSSENKTTPEQIIEKMQDVYTALSSYSDNGKVTSFIGATAVAPHTFTIKLARPNLYRIEWDQDNTLFDQKGAVWSAGSGDFVQMGERSATKYTDEESALSAATGLSGRASASIPGAFFKLNWGNHNQFDSWTQSAKRKSDELVGDIHCYVLMNEKAGRTRTLWIGKKDFLIYQIEEDTSAKVFKATLETAAKGNPQLEAFADSVVGDSKSIQTHMHIVLNQSFSPADFEHQTPR